MRLRSAGRRRLRATLKGDALYDSLSCSLYEILPHHRLDGPDGPPLILCTLSLVVRKFHVSADFEIDQLSDGHPRIDPHGLSHGDFERPCVAESDVAFPRRGVDVDPEPSDAALSLEEGNVPVRFGVLARDAEIQFARDEDHAFGGNPERVDAVVLPGIEDLIPVEREPTPKVDIVAVGTKVSPVEGLDDDGSLAHFGENLAVRQDHAGSEP